MNRLKFTALAAVAGLAPCAVLALGLGEIQVNSKLNQALDAEIELLYDDESEPQSTEVSLASADDFQRVGLDPSALTAKLDFEIRRNAAGQYVISVTSRDLITDPFVDFLIDVNWPNGRLLREYVVLLDPPVTPPSGPAEVRPAAQQPATTPPRTTTAPTPGQPSSTPSAGTASPRQVAAEGDYEVRRGDTLWEIARDNRAGDVTINQMMMSLYRLNPDAFFQDNINALKAGAILRMPGSSETADASVAQALAAVRTQNEAWENYRRSASGRTPVVSDQSAGPDYLQPDRDVADATDSRLRLVPPSTGDSAGSAGGAQDLERLEGLREELARSREELVSSQAENSDLRSRVGDLENLVANLERTISLKDADLADLQNQSELLRDNAGAVDDAGFADSGDEDAGFDDELAAIEQELSAAADDLGGEDTLGDSGGFDDTTADDSLAAADPVDQDADDSQAEPAVDTPAKSEPGLVDRLIAIATRPLVWGSAAAIAVLALIVGLLARRRAGSDDLGGESLVDRMMSAEQATSELPAAMADLGGTDDGPDDEPAEGPDVDELRNAVSADPQNAQPHLALLRVHYAAEDRDSFLAAAEQMHDAVGGASHPAWMEVRAMGASLAPDHPLFSDSGEIAAEVESEDASGDFDLGGDDSIAALADDGLSLDDDNDDDLTLDTEGDDDFDLGGGDDSVALGDDGLSLEDASDDELALEFDLDAGGDDALETADTDLDEELDLDLDLDGIDLGDDEPQESASSDADTDFELPAIGAENPDTTAEMELDIAPAQDEQAREESETLAELESADDELDDLGLDDLDLDGDELFGDEDAVGTKLDLAKAYIDMGDPDGARGMLEEVIAEGTDSQKEEAKGLLGGLDS